MRPAASIAVLAAAFALLACDKQKVCAADEQLCRDSCVALAADPSNCGACGNVCAAGEACHQGACTDCASACGAGQRCVAGMCVADVYAACFNENRVRGVSSDLQPVGVPLQMTTPIAFAALGGELYVADGTANTISVVSFDPTPAVTAAISLVGTVPQFPDLEYLAANAGLLWVSNAAAGTLVAVDPAHGVLDEVPLAAAPGEFTNPQGIDFVGTKAYLALQGANAIAVLDLSSVSACQPPSSSASACAADGSCPAGTTCVNGLCQRTPCGKVSTRIDLSPLAAPGANAAPARVLAVGSRVYVTLNDLFDAAFHPVPGAHGRLAVLDVASDSIVGGAIDLGPECLDASGLALSGSTLWVSCGYYDFVSVSGGAFVPVDLSGAVPVPGTPVTLQNAAASIAFCGGRGYAGSLDSGTLLSLDPATGTVDSVGLCQPVSANFIAAVACAPAP